MTGTIAKKKTGKKTTKKVDKGFSFDDLETDLKKFEVRVMNKETKVEVPPYMIPFRHRGLQKITGGIIGGTFCEISGNSGSGKSFVAYDLVAEVQKMGGVVVLQDGENAWDDAYALMVGINVDDGTFIITKERDMDKLFAMKMKIIAAVRKKKKNIPILFIDDSYYTLATKKSLENAESGADPQGFYHKQKNGKFSSHMDTFVPHLGKTKSTYVLLNQTRLATDENTGRQFFKTLCEDVIQFISTQRIQGTLIGSKDTEEVASTNSKGKKKVRSGIKTCWETIKNRTVRPFQKINTLIKYDSGLRRNSGLVELFVSENLIKASTTSKTREGEKVTKTIKGFKVIETDIFYYSMNELLAVHPKFLDSIKTADSIQKEVEEDFE